VHGKVSRVSVTVRIDTELPRQEAAFSGLVHAADLAGTVDTRRIGSSRPREGVLETQRTPAVGHGIRSPLRWAVRRFAFGDRFDQKQNGHSV
jgi:hypothetical protein